MHTISRYLVSGCIFIFILTATVLASFFMQRPGDRVTPLLKAPGIIDHWCRQSKLAAAASAKEHNSPLVQEARAYALLLDPPAPPEPVTKPKPVINPPPAPIVRPPTTSAKFKVYATSVYTADPARSMALIAEPGGATRWIRQGECLGHLEVAEIKMGMLHCRNGEQLIEVALEKESVPTLSTEPAAPPARGYAMDITEGVVHPQSDGTETIERIAARPARLSAPMRPISPKRARSR